MHRVAWVLGVLGLAACGRVGFGPLAGGDDGAPGDADPSSDAATADLVVRYPMDALTGGGVPATTAGYDGACTSCPSLVAGRDGGAYAFAGAEGIHLPAISAGLVGEAPYTVTLWLRTTSVLADRALVARPFGIGGSSNVLAINIPDDPGVITFESTSEGTLYDYLDAPTSTAVNDGAWHFISARWDGAAKAIGVDDAFTRAPATLQQGTEDLPVWLGTDLDRNAEVHHLAGDLDDVRFYRRALSDAELMALRASYSP